MDTKGYRQMQFWIPEELHRQLTAELEKTRRQPKAQAAASLPTRCGMVIITESEPTGDAGNWLHCGGKCSWWDRLRGRSCKWTSQGPYTWCSCG
jgi:hypothetical protein